MYCIIHEESVTTIIIYLFTHVSIKYRHGSNLFTTNNCKYTMSTSASKPTKTPIIPVAVYGFLGWVTSAVFYVVYLVWSCTPDSILHWHGITYYPSKYWATAVPTWICMSGWVVFLGYMCLNRLMEYRMVRASGSSTKN